MGGRRFLFLKGKKGIELIEPEKNLSPARIINCDKIMLIMEDCFQILASVKYQGFLSFVV